jgi:lactate permease
MHTVGALFVPIIALRFAVGWGQIRWNLLYIYLSILSCALRESPYPFRDGWIHI